MFAACKYVLEITEIRGNGEAPEGKAALLLTPPLSQVFDKINELSVQCAITLNILYLVSTQNSFEW